MVATQIGLNEYKGVPLDIFYWQSDKHGWDNSPVPEMAGVYVISGFSSEGAWLGFKVRAEALYVGQTTNLRKRHDSHEILADLRSEYDVIKFSFMPILNATDTFLREIERVLINTYKPLLNKQHNQNRGYNDCVLDKFDR